MEITMTNASRPSPRAERREHFLGEDGWPTYLQSFELLICAEHLLVAALHQRRFGYRLVRTHYAPAAMGVITMISNALDAFLNEVFTFRGMRDVAEESSSPDKKVAQLAPSFDTTDLRLLYLARNEITHYLPRSVPKGDGHVADALREWERRGLLMITPATSSWVIPQRLASYALAFWAFETVESAIGAIVAATPADAWVSTYTAPNFFRFRELVLPPDGLGEYDRQFELTPTEVV